MNKDRIIDSMGRIDDDMIQSVEILRKRKRNTKGVWSKWAAAAAGICLVIAVTAIWHTAMPSDEKKEGAIVSENGITIPQMEVSLSANEAADMIGFFIYQGRCYVQYEWIYEDVDIVGEYLGTATGMIDEWTPKDGYVDFAGSVRGDFYSVQGYDPSFMLCIKDATGAVCTYICNTGITLKYGAELYEDRLHLSDYESVQYESRVSWYEGLGECYELDQENGIDIIQKFMEQLNQAEFMLCADIPLEENTSLIDMEIYHMYFKMKDGTTIHLRLYENGYVRFQGLLDVCVQIPAEYYDPLVALMDGRVGSEVDSAPDSMGTTVEDCKNDPELGAYVPNHVPEDMRLEQAHIYYYLDQKTGDETGTKEIYLYYVGLTNPDQSYTITITWADEYGENGWAGPMVDSADLDLDTILEHLETEVPEGYSPSRYPVIDIGVWHEDVSVVISARAVDPENVLLIMD